MPAPPDAADQGGATIPRFTRTEVAVWVVYAIVAVVVVAVPLATHTFSLAVVGAWVLVLGAAAMSWGFLRSGVLRTEEWLSEDEYEEFLREMHRPFDPPEPG